MGELIQQYRQELSRRRSKGTTYIYPWVAGYYLEHCRGNFSRQTLLSFIDSFSEGRNNYARWLQYVLAKFWKFLQGQGKVSEPYPLDRDDLPQPKDDLEIQRPTMARENAERLIAWAKEEGQPRERAYLALSTCYGLRKSEIQAVRREDIGEMLLVRTAKGGGMRRHLIPEEIRPHLEEYSFRSYTPQALTALFPVMCNKAGVERHSNEGFHSIRRSLVTELNANGAPMPLILDFMRWRAPRGSSMPLYYFRPSPEETDGKIFSQYHPFLSHWR